MDPLNSKLLTWLQGVQEDLGSPSCGREHPLEGCLLEDARIGRLLGVGSFAAVFELETSQAPLAVKILPRATKDLAEDEVFRREVDIGMQLEHPTITRIHRFIERPATRFVVLDRVEGDTWVKLAEEKVSPTRYRELFRPLAEGLNYAHDKGIVHRDLKPENVMLGTDGQVRILDFGLARHSGDGDSSSTVTGQFKGTPMYSAPEQVIDSKRVTPACDQFAFGLLSYQFLSGEFPYPLDPKQPLMTLFARLQGPPKSLVSVWPEAGAEADAVMARILAMKPEDRYPSVLEAYQALSEALPP